MGKIKRIINKAQKLMTTVRVVSILMLHITVVYATPEPQSETTTDVATNAKGKEYIQSHTSIIYHAKDKPHVIVPNSSNIKDSDVEAKLREQIIQELRNAHSNGKYKDITEDMIMGLSGRELRSLVLSEYLADEQSWNFVKESNLTDVPTDVDYTDLYSSPKETQESILLSIRDYAAEKKEAAGILALGAGGSLLFLKKGRRLLRLESEQAANARHQKIHDIENNTTNNIKFSKQQQDAEYYYSSMYKPYFSDEDNLRNLTELYTASGITLKQEKTIADNFNNVLGNESKALHKLYKDMLAEMRQQEEYKNYSDKALDKKLEEKIYLKHGENGKKLLKVMKTGNVPKINASKNMSERLIQSDNDIREILYGKKS